MKKLLLSALILTAITEHSIAAIVGQWKLQDNIAANFVVAATVGSNGTLEGSSGTSAVSSLSGPGTALARCFLLDGVDDHAPFYSVNYGLAKNKSVITLCCWIKCSTADTTTTHRIIYFNNGTVAATTRCSLDINASGQISCTARAGDAESGQVKTSSSSYDDDTWHHIAAVIDYASDTITLYVDGSSVSSTGSISFTWTATSNTDSLSAFLFRGGAASGYYKGRVCDCRIYDSNETANLATIMAEANSSASSVAKILLQLSDARLRKQTNHFDTYGVYALLP